MSNPFVDTESGSGAQDALPQDITLKMMKAVDCSLQHRLTCVLLVRFGVKGQGLRRLVTVVYLLASWLSVAAMIALLMDPLVEHLWHIISAAMPGVRRLLPLHR